MKANWEPVQGGKHQVDVLIPFCPSNETSSSILDQLETVKGALADT